MQCGFRLSLSRYRDKVLRPGAAQEKARFSTKIFSAQDKSSHLMIIKLATVLTRKINNQQSKIDNRNGDHVIEMECYEYGFIAEEQPKLPEIKFSVAYIILTL